MDMEKLKGWLDITKQFHQDSFWKEIFHEQKAQHPKPSTHLEKEPNNECSSEQQPKCDVYVVGNQLIVEAEIPVHSRNNFNVSLLKNSLLIKGEIKTLHPHGQYLLKERYNGPFNKEIQLPFAIKRNEIRSIFHGGVLQVILPIEVETAEMIDLVIHDDKMQSRE